MAEQQPTEELAFIASGAGLQVSNGEYRALNKQANGSGGGIEFARQSGDGRVFTITSKDDGKEWCLCEATAEGLMILYRASSEQATSLPPVDNWRIYAGA